MTKPDQQQKPKLTLEAWVEKHGNANLKGILKGDRLDVFLGSVRALLKGDAKLLTAAQRGGSSFWAAMVQLAHDDLVPGKEALVTTYESKRHGTCFSLQKSYQGILAAFARAGIAVSGPELVREHDELDVSNGVEGGKRIDRIIHRPNVRSDRGEIIGGVFYWRNVDGSWSGRFVDRKSFDDAKEFSRAKAEDSPWNTHPEAMMLKTVIHRCARYIARGDGKPLDDFVFGNEEQDSSDTAVPENKSDALAEVGDGDGEKSPSASAEEAKPPREQPSGNPYANAPGQTEASPPDDEFDNKPPAKKAGRPKKQDAGVDKAPKEAAAATPPPAPETAAPPEVPSVDENLFDD